MKSVMLLLGAVVIILLLPAVLPSIQDFRSDSYEEAHGVVTTAAGVTSANLTLAQDLFLDENSQVTSITSNVTADVPLVSTYTKANDRLLITGLIAGTTRTLTVTYNTPVLGDFYGADLGTRVFPIFLVLGVIGIVAAAVYNATKRE